MHVPSFMSNPWPVILRVLSKLATTTSEDDRLSRSASTSAGTPALRHVTLLVDRRAVRVPLDVAATFLVEARFRHPVSKLHHRPLHLRTVGLSTWVVCELHAEDASEQVFHCARYARDAQSRENTTVIIQAQRLVAAFQ